jgi:hypothetical protein
MVKSVIRMMPYMHRFYGGICLWTPYGKKMRKKNYIYPHVYVSKLIQCVIFYNQAKVS